MKPHQLEQEYTALYKAEVDAIFRYCLIRTSQREVARDLTQDAFMRLWDALKRDPSIRNSRAFLYTIARNLIIDWYRKKKAESLESLIENSDNQLPISLAESTAEELEYDAEARYLMDKIRELEPTYQHVVFLRFVEGLKPKEIASIVGESVNVVSVRISRGVEKLRQITGYGKIK